MKLTIEYQDRMHPVDLINDTGEGVHNDRLYLFGNEFGPHTLVASTSFQDAFDAWLEAQPEIDEDEIYEAYGFDSEAEYLEADEPNLAEGYHYHGSFGNTGIVAVGPYEWQSIYHISQITITGERL